MTTRSSRTRSSSLIMHREDALSASCGMLFGLLAFSRDKTEFAGGSLVLSLSLLALYSENHQQEFTSSLWRTPTRIFNRGLVVLHMIVSWALLWFTLVSLETSSSRWFIPFGLVYGLFVLSRRHENGNPFVVVSLLGLFFCMLTSRILAPRVGLSFGLTTALASQTVWWIINLTWIPSNTKSLARENLPPDEDCVPPSPFVLSLKRKHSPCGE